jgi:hypothetical protein
MMGQPTRPVRVDGSGVELAVRVLLLPLRALRTPTGRRMLAAAAMAAGLVTVVLALYGHPDTPAATGPPATPTTRTAATPTADRAGVAAAAWYARSLHVPLTRVRVVNEHQVSATVVQVVVVADLGQRLPSTLVTVHRDAGGWAVT